MKDFYTNTHCIFILSSLYYFSILVKLVPWKKKSCFVNLLGVTPTMVHFKLPTWCHWTWSWEGVYTISSCKQVWNSFSTLLTFSLKFERTQPVSGKTNCSIFNVMECHSAIKRSKLLIHTTTWMNLKDNMLNEGTQTQKSTYRMLSLYEILEHAN